MNETTNDKPLWIFSTWRFTLDRRDEYIPQAAHAHRGFPLSV
jgi:hypothetical protein